MANDATFVTSGIVVFTIPILIWKGPIRLNLEPMYQRVDQDGPKGGRNYEIDKRPRDYQVEIWGDASNAPVIGIFDFLTFALGKLGTLTFFDGHTEPNVRLLDVQYVSPIGIGTSAGTNTLESCLTMWSKEK